MRKPASRPSPAPRRFALLPPSRASPLDPTCTSASFHISTFARPLPPPSTARARSRERVAATERARTLFPRTDNPRQPARIATMVHPLPPSSAVPAPIASTSRIPYSAAAAAPARTFFTSRPTPSPRAHTHRRAHLIHPLARQRLTNLSFALAGLLSVATVSLGMSGTFGSAGVRPGCPARKDAAVALQEEGRRAREERERGGGWKGKGRFLDDPVVPAVQAAAPPLPFARPPAGRFERVPRAEERAAEERAAEEQAAASGSGRIAEPAPTPASKGAGWRGWVGTSERVV